MEEGTSAWRRTRNSWRRTAAFVIAFAAIASPTLRVQDQSAQPIRLAWDANPEPGVVGYLVYVGTRSRVYTETYDAGNQTTFSYRSTVLGRQYYFAVAAYFAGPVIGPRSSEVSGSAGPVTRPAPPGEEPSVLCAETRPMDCYARVVRAEGLKAISGFAATGDGRLFVIENEREIRVVAEDSLVAAPALSLSDRGTRITGIALDPRFATTGHVFVGITQARADGTRELSIARYREVQNVLGERAVIVAALPLSASSDAPFSLDEAGHIYVAMPGRILRFNSDGTVPRDNHAGSPVFAQGFARSIALDTDGHDLWAVGVDPRWPNGIARLTLEQADDDQWPRLPVAAHIVPPPSNSDVRVQAFDAGPRARGAASKESALVLESDRRLYWLQTSGDNTEQLVTVAWTGVDVPMFVAFGPQREVYVAVQRVGGDFSLIELERRR